MRNLYFFSTPFYPPPVPQSEAILQGEGVSALLPSLLSMGWMAEAGLPTDDAPGLRLAGARPFECPWTPNAGLPVGQI